MNAIASVECSAEETPLTFSVVLHRTEIDKLIENYGPDYARTEVERTIHRAMNELLIELDLIR